MFRRVLTCVLSTLLFLNISAGRVNADDTYPYRSKCPTGDIPPVPGYTTHFPGGAIEDGQWFPLNPSNPNNSEYWYDKWGFAQCNCTSYVAAKLNEAWHGSPAFNNGYFHRSWKDAKTWRQAAEETHHIGITGAQDDFVFNKSVLNGAFKGDIAWWEHLSGYGHVAMVEEDATSGPEGRGIGCVKISDYNRSPRNGFGTKTICRNSDGTFPSDFPDAFIHITQNHEYCLLHYDECGSFLAQLDANTQLANMVDGVFGGGPESSNSYPITGGTTSGSLPDLIAKESDIEDGSRNKTTVLRVKQDASCRMQAKNTGSRKAGFFKSTCYISNGEKIDENPLDKATTETQELNDGDTHTEHASFHAPKYPGTYNAVWCVNSGGNVRESNMGNNCHEEDKFTVISSPNVVAQALSIQGNPVTLAPGQPFVADFTFTNSGENIGRTMLVGWYLDGVLSATDPVLRENFESGNVKIETWETGIAPMTEGMHELKACGNFDHRVPGEADPNNDCITKMIEVRRPWDPQAPGAVLWPNTGTIPLELSCGTPPPEPNFSRPPARGSGDIASTIFGPARQRLFISPTYASLASSGFWGTPSFRLDQVTKWCWSSDQVGWGTDHSRTCAKPIRQSSGWWTVDLRSTPRADKGTWSLRVRGEAQDRWAKTALWTNKRLDAQGHVRYGGWAPNRAISSVTPEGYLKLTLQFGTFGLPGFWSPGTALTNQAFWYNAQTHMIQTPGNVWCNPATGKLIAEVTGVPSLTPGRVILGASKLGDAAWQNKSWTLPSGSSFAENGDYSLTTPAQTRSLQATYDTATQRLTLFVPSRDFSLWAFTDVSDIRLLTNNVVFHTWIGGFRDIRGTATQSADGSLSIAFDGVQSGEGGSVYLVKTDSTKAWLWIDHWNFGSNIQVHSASDGAWLVVP